MESRIAMGSPTDLDPIILHNVTLLGPTAVTLAPLTDLQVAPGDVAASPPVVEAAPAVATGALLTVRRVTVPDLAGRLDLNNVVHLIDPSLLRAIDAFQPTDGLLPRSALHMPAVLISPTDSPTDQTVFQDPGDPTQTYWLGGGFSIASRREQGPLGSVDVPWVTLGPGKKEEGSGFVLEVHLAPPDALDPPPDHGAKPMPDDVKITHQMLIQATLPDGAAYTHEFDEVTLGAGGDTWTLRMHLQGATAVVDIHRLYTAMATSTDCRLVVRRSISKLAFLASTPKLLRFTATAIPRLSLDQLGLPIKHLSPSGAAVASPVASVPPAAQPATPAAPAVSMYRLAETAIDSVCANFTFYPMVFPSIYSGFTGAGATQLGWIPHPVDWQPDPGTPGVTHTYYQDMSDHRTAYFVPDRYVIQRRDQAPFRPWLSLTVLEDGTKLSLSYVAVPTFSRARVDAALSVLREQGQLPPDATMKLFPAGKASLRLYLPKGDPSTGGPGYVEQVSSVNIQTEVALHGNVTLPSDDFQSVFDALVNDDSNLLSGFVDFSIDKDPHQIPFVLRADQFTGPMLDMEVAPDTTQVGAVRVTLRNGIESPIQVTTLPIALIRGGAAVAASVISANPPLPATLQAQTEGTTAGTIAVVVAPTDGLGEDLQVRPDFSGCRALPDAAALLQAILDPATQAHSTRQITIQLLASIFTPPASPDDAPPPPLVVRVEFEGSTSTADFAAGQAPATGSPFLAQSMTLQFPMRDYLLGRISGTGSQYRYRIHVLGAAGEKVGEPITDHLDTLYILSLPA